MLNFDKLCVAIFTSPSYINAITNGQSLISWWFFVPHASHTRLLGVSINFRVPCCWGFDGPLSLLELDELELELEDLEFLMTALSLFNVGNFSEEVACL